MVLAYLNFVAMIVGYVTIAVVLLIILAFIGLVLREKYNDLRWRREHEKKQEELEKQSNATAMQTKSQPAEQNEATKETTQDKPNVQLLIK